MATITMELELAQTFARTTAWMKEADKLIWECAERHNRCQQCSQEMACRAEWGKFLNKHVYAVSKVEFCVFKKTMENIEQEGNRRNVDTKVLETSLGALVICVNVVAMMCGLWGAVV
jgi:hypothetical protein